MHYLSEDPTYLAGGLGVAAAALLVALKVTQQGKYLIYALVAAALALVVLLVERVWVTEDERIEAVVYALAEAVGRGDGEGAATYLDPKCVIELGGPSSGLGWKVATRFGVKKPVDWLREDLGPDLRFDWLRVTRLEAKAGKLSGLGTAEFVVHTMGTSHLHGSFATPPSGMGWSLGFREASPHEWKVTRISPGRVDSEER